MLRLLIVGCFFILTNNAYSADFLTTDQTRPYAKKCAQGIDEISGKYSFYAGMLMDDTTHSYYHGDEARSSKTKTGDAEQFFSTIIQQEFKDIAGNKKFRVWACEFTINDGTQVYRFNPGCQSLNSHVSFVSKNEASHNDFEEFFFYRDQYIILDSECS